MSKVMGGSGDDKLVKSDWKLLCQGAECRLWTGRAFNTDVVKKERFRKHYRNAILDEKLTRERMRAELRAIVKLKERCPKLSLVMPTIWFVTDREIIMDRITDSITINEYTKKKCLEECQWLYELLGETIALIHSSGLIHGDLTTSNFLLRSDHQLVPIDFGLASFNESDEDRSVDLYVLERSLLANQVEHADGFKYVLDKYKCKMGKSGQSVLNKLKEVQLRGRKRSMVG